MIDKLSDINITDDKIVEKINEIIEEFNHHYHAVEAQDRDITTGPRSEDW